MRLALSEEETMKGPKLPDSRSRTRMFDSSRTQQYHAFRGPSTFVCLPEGRPMNPKATDKKTAR